MSLTPPEEKTKNTYDQIAREWSANHTSRDFYKGEMARFKQLLPEGKVLEVGSGGGRDAMELIAMGYEYVGTDISAGLLEIARENNPGAEFHQQSIYELQFEHDHFDGFWASAVLLHIPKDRIDKALGRIHDVVKKGGIGFISMHAGEGEGIRDNEKGGRHFSYYSLEEFTKVLHRNRFDIIESKVKEGGEDKTWLYFFVKVRK